MLRELFIDTALISRSHDGESICGDPAQSFGSAEGPVFVLSDGMGSGVKANILATLTCTILGRLLEHGIKLTECVDTIAATLPICRDRRMAYATFTAVQIDKGSAFLVEYDNPPAILIRDGRAEKSRYKVRFVGDKEIRERRIDILPGDVLVIMSDGVTHSGIGHGRLDGLSQEELGGYLASLRPDTRPAAETAALLDGFCSRLSENCLEDDRTIAVMRFTPRKTLNLLMGPPSDPEDDAKLLKLFFAKKGSHVVCGGSTSLMAARYLGKELEPMQGSGDDRVPDMARIEGLDLVTEGVITLRETLSLRERCLEKPEQILNLGQGPEALLYRALFLESGNVNLFFGRASNKAHDSLDISFEKKLEAMRELERLLREAGKTVKIQYF